MKLFFIIQWLYFPFQDFKCTCRVQRKFGRRRSSYFPYSSFRESRCFRAQGLPEFLTGMASGTETLNRNHGDFPALYPSRATRSGLSGSSKL